MRMLDEEKADAKKIIKDLADTNFSGSNKEQGKMAALIKGLAFSDDPDANTFMKALDTFTTNYGKKSAKKESITVKGNGEMLDIDEDYSVELEEGKNYSIQEVVKDAK